MAAPELPRPRYTVTDPKGNHRYQVELPDGTVIPKLQSVTGVLGVINKPALIPWATRTACEQIERRLMSLAGQDVTLTPEWISAVVAEGKRKPEAVKDEAAELGTAAHVGFEAVIKGEEPKVPATIAPAISEFRRWLGTTRTVIVAQELPIGSARHRFGGRLDAVGWRDGNWGILDWKTSSGIYNEYALQTAGGYAIAMEEQYGIAINWVDIARFPKKAPWGTEVRPVVNLKAARQAFLDALNLGRALDSELLGPASYSSFAVVEPAVAAKRAGKHGF